VSARVLRQSEAALQRKLIELCKTAGWLAQKTESPGNAGWPDVTVLVQDRKGEGHAAFVEVKRPGEEPTKLQAHVLKELNRMGFVAFWSDDPVGAFVRLRREFGARRWL